jgi:hypothetical protein
MLSPHAAQRLALSFLLDKIAQGVDMSSWKILRSHPTKLSPQNLVLLAEHTGEDIGTLLNHGIGVDNRVCDLQRLIKIDGTLISAAA